jgi:hypothetical protein
MGSIGSCAYLEDLPADVQRRRGRNRGVAPLLRLFSGASRLGCEAVPDRLRATAPATAIGIVDHAIGFFRFRRLGSSGNPAPKQFASLN